MRRRLAVFVAAAALATMAAVGTGSTAALADPPSGGGWISLGWYGSLADCVAAAQANYPHHGPVYICEQYGSFYRLWMH